MKKDLRERLVLAALKALKDRDPITVIGIGDNEIRIMWVPNDNSE